MKSKLEQTVVDRVVSYFNPVAGQRRLKARATMSAVGSYVGGDRTRRSFRSWLTSSKSADDDLLPSLAALREHSRDLVRNAPLATGAINTVVTNVIGTGLAMQSRIDADVLDMTDDEVAQWQRITDREFKLWAENPRECDSTATQNFYGLQDLAFRSTLVNGDVLSIQPSVTRPGCVYGVKVQLVEGDRLSTPHNHLIQGTIYGGVEVDDYGAPIAYHVANHHPGSAAAVKGLKWDRIVARGANSGRRNAMLLYRRMRPDQRRGEPYLAPVIESLKQLDRYTEAEITAAVISGMFTVFIEHADPEDHNGIPELGGGENTPSLAPELNLSSGAVLDLGIGEKATVANPGRPNPAYDPFVMSILRQVGVALELPFEVLIKHFTASYSAARAALLEAWKFFKNRRMWLADDFCQPVYETWLAEAVALGRINAPGFFADPILRKAWSGATWLGDGPGSIDPLKEANAIEKRIDLGITTLAEETAGYDGGDWETKHVQRVKEQTMRLAGGLIPPLIPPLLPPSLNPLPTVSETQQPDPPDPDSSP